MLSAHSRQATMTTTFEPGQSFFSPSKTGRISTTPTVVTVVTRRVPVPKQPAPTSQPATPMPSTMALALQSVAPKSISPSSSLSSLSSASSVVETQATKKRKAGDAPPKASKTNYGSNAKKRRVDSPTPSSSSSARPKKRASGSESLRAAAHARARANVLAPEELVYRLSRSRSTTAFEPEHASRERKTWTDEDGAVGDELMSSEKVVKGLMHSYKAYFRNLDDPDDISFEPSLTNYPFADLEYPNDNASERFILLEPKDKDHYNPIMCLELSLHSIIRYYLTPEQKALFGTLPEELLVTPSNSPPNSCVGDIMSSSPLSSLSSLSPLSVQTSSPLTSLSAESACTSTRHSPAPSNNLLRALNRAKHLRDGPGFISIMCEINKLLRALKNPTSGSNPLRQVPRTWSTNGIPQKLLLRIIEESYQRCIGPHVESLKKYSAFSSHVYGELMPAFTSDIIAQTGLRPGSLFVDLGSGVGNVVLQAALQSGCTAFGVEVMDTPAALAEGQRAQMKLRCRMWGIEMGEVELAKADMTACPRVDELMCKADVVLVNNFVFKEELNAALRPKFLDLKEGAIVVSLKPFAPPSNQRLTERNIDDISAIFDVSSRPYHSGTVSWSSGSGQYYIHRVDREGYRDSRAQYERLQARLGRRKGGVRR